MTVGSLGSSRVRLVRLLIDHRLDVEVVGWPARRARPVDPDGGYGRSPRGPQIHGAMALPARSVPIVDPGSTVTHGGTCSLSTGDADMRWYAEQLRLGR